MQTYLSDVHHCNNEKKFSVCICHTFPEWDARETLREQNLIDITISLVYLKFKLGLPHSLTHARYSPHEKFPRKVNET